VNQEERHEKPPPKTPAEPAHRVMEKRREELLSITYKKIVKYGEAARPSLLKEPVAGNFDVEITK